METSERYRAFMVELASLLGRYGAEIEIDDDGRPYGMHSALARVSFSDPWEESRLPGFMDSEMDT